MTRARRRTALAALLVALGIGAGAVVLTAALGDGMPRSDEEAASLVVRSSFEPRPENAAANARTPTPAEIGRFRAANRTVHDRDEVTGAFTGTTDEIIQWAAAKWRLPVDVLRAAASQESTWRMSQVGDAGQSFGIFQIKRTVHAGTHPLSELSTAFNADYYGAVLRTYMDGHTPWVEDVEHGRPYEEDDLWGAVGAHFAGRWWTPPAIDYMEKVRARLAARDWAQPGY